MAEAKTIQITITPDEKLIVLASLELQQKSFERAARQHELMNKPAIAEAVRQELRKLVEIKHKIDVAK